MAANRDLLREGMATGLTAPRIVTERTIAQLERLLEIPRRPVGHHDRRQGRLGGRPGADRAPRPRRDHAGRPGVPRRAQGRLPRGQPRGSRALVGAQRRRPLPDADPGLDDARDRTPRRSTGSGWRSSSRSRRSAGRSPVAPASATTPPPTGPRWPPSRRTSRRPRGAARPGPRSDIDRALALAPRYFGRLPRAGCDVRAVESFKEKDSPFAYYIPPTTDGSRAGHLLREHLRPAVADVHEARLDHLPRGGSRPPLPDRPRDGEREPQRLPAARLADGRRRLRRGLGTVRRAPGRRDGPLPQRGRTVRDARRAGLAGRPARRRQRAPCAPLAAPAVDRHAPRGRVDADRRDDRDRPLHRLAGPGPHLQARPAGDRAAPGRDLGP